MANKSLTWLEHAGALALHIAETAASKVLPIAAEVAQEAEPIMALALPMYGPIYNKVVAAVIATEQDYAAKGQQTGTGSQKLQSVLGAVEADLLPSLNQAGLTGQDATAAATSYINGIQTLLNGPVISTVVNKAAVAGTQE